MRAPLEALIEAVLPEVEALRHDLHRHPELGFDLERTARVVQDYLAPLGLEVRGGVAGTGVLATLRGAREGPVVALRADMDALPLSERTGVDYQSAQEGRMHACGHDGHTAILLGVAKVLSHCREQLAGTVQFIFQPAEESGGGGQVLCAEGVLRDPPVAAIFALHAWPDLQAGQIGLTPGPMLAATDSFEIVVRGCGAHGAKPHEGVDPIVIAARIIDGLQAIVSRERDPVEPVVVTVGQIRAGTATNIIPEECYLAGTIRTLTPERRKATGEAVRRIAEGLAAAFRATAEVTLQEGYPPTINDPACVDYVARIGAEVLGPENVVWLQQPSMGGEDFAYYLQQVPGALFRLGVGPDSAPLHNAHFNFNDAALRPGLRMLCHLAWQFAEKGPPAP
jgi:amidohydrolase